MDYLMAIDLGSTSLKAVIYDLDGNCAASASRPTEKVTPDGHPEWVVWDPDNIWQGAAAAAKEAVSNIDDPSLIRAVAVTGMGMDGVPIDENGDHLYSFISWHDARTNEQAEWWKDTIGSERTFSITGFPCWAMLASMRVLWMKQNEPEIMARANKWLLIEDFLNHKLCGAIATDFSMASCMLLLDQTTRQWSDELIEASGIERGLLPEPRQSGTVLGKIGAEASALTGLPEGAPVVLGGHDHICGTIPVGAYKPGTVLDILGTWESVLAAVSTPVMTPEIQQSAVCMQSHVVPDMYAAWGGAVAGESLEWFRREFGEGGSWEDLMAGLADTKPGASGVLYLPYISAAGCPIDDNEALGAFIGLSSAATRADMLRAVIEGLNYQFLDIVRTMESGLGCEFNNIVVAGGGAHNDFWIQNKADMIGRPIEAPQVEEATPLGTAVLAGLGVGLYKSIDEAYERVRRPGKIYNPNLELTERYSKYFDIYKGMYPALKDLSHGIFREFRG